MNLIRIPSLIDNYIWLLISKNNCIIVDPGSSKLVLKFLKYNFINPLAVLLTHHHNDHVYGVKELKKKYPNLRVYGSIKSINNGVTDIVSGGDHLIFNEFSFIVFYVPGHTLDHVAYYQQPYLFSGDTLFSGGCGRIFEGTTEEMFSSINKLNDLPNDTLICAAHEYTYKNMQFASTIFPDDFFIKKYTIMVYKKHLKKEPTLPSLLKIEKKINIFLRTNDVQLKKKMNLTNGNYSDFDLFVILRNLRDNF